MTLKDTAPATSAVAEIEAVVINLQRNLEALDKFVGSRLESTSAERGRV